MFQSPLGFLFFQTFPKSYNEKHTICFNPLWGFCSSKRDVSIIIFDLIEFQSPLGFLFFQTSKQTGQHRRRYGFNPLWGFCSSKQKMKIADCFMNIVSIPFGVSVLPNLNLKVKMVFCTSLFQSPLGFLFFQTQNT
mgnify:CR=1 FL=1